MSSIFRSTTSYALAARLTGHSDSVYSLAISPSGKLLASGGGDGVRIWDLKTNKQIASLPQSRSLHGPVTCLQWLTQRDDPLETLCYGTGLGYFVVCRQVPDLLFQEIYSKRLATGQEITCLSANVSHDALVRIAVGTRDKIVQVLVFDIQDRVKSVFCVRLDTTVPIAVGFTDKTGKDVLVFGLFNGQLHILKGDDGTILSTMEVGGLIGNVAINRNQFVIDTVANGFSLYQLENAIWKRDFPTGTPSRKLPKQVAFGEDSKVVVGGSDHGVVYVFDKKTASPLQILRHGDQGMVQTLTTYSKNDTSMIVSASSSNCRDISICVWVRKYTKEKAIHSRKAVSETSIFFYIFQMVMALGFVTCVYQNVQPPDIRRLREFQLKLPLQWRDESEPRQSENNFGPHPHKERTNVKTRAMGQPDTDYTSLKEIFEQVMKTSQEQNEKILAEAAGKVQLGRVEGNLNEPQSIATGEET